jgi:hypothetical protein
MTTVSARPADVIGRDYAEASLQLADAGTYEQAAVVPSGDLHGLNVLREKWTRELSHLVMIDPERTQHLAEALDDLAILIGRAKTAE